MLGSHPNSPVRKWPLSKVSLSYIQVKVNLDIAQFKVLVLSSEMWQPVAKGKKKQETGLTLRGPNPSLRDCAMQIKEIMEKGIYSLLWKY